LPAVINDTRKEGYSSIPFTSELKTAQATDEPLSTEPISETEKTASPWLCSGLGGC